MRNKDKLNILLFDADCLLCNETVKFILKHDDQGIFKIGTLQSSLGKSYLDRYEVKDEMLTTMVYINGDQALTKTSAVLEILRTLGGFWQLLYVLKIFPAFIRDPIYKLVSRNRFKWFGKVDSCIIANPAFKSRLVTEMANSSHSQSSS